MKTIKILLLVCCLSHQAKAQQLQYEVLDSLSTVISALQSTAENAIYFDGADEYKLRFPARNFGLWLHDKTAYNAVYKEWNGGMALAVTEHVDLGKATGITYRSATGNRAGAILLYFPLGTLRTQYYENGILTHTVSQEFLPFYCNASPEHIGELYSAILVLYFAMKIGAGEYTEQQAQDLGNAYTHALTTNTVAGYKDFLSNYPNSIFGREVLEKISALTKTND